MAHKQVLLDLADFMDSPHAAKVEGVAREEVRSIAGKFLAVCHEELGEKPRLLDGQAMHGALGHLLPARFKKKDPLAEKAPDVLRAYLDHLEESQVVTQAFEIRQGFETTIDEFLETVRTGVNAHGHHHQHHGEKQETIKHVADKLGRNDPCSCGSGKKYKKCHGKGL